MNAKLIKGNNLSPQQLQQVKNAFVHRHMAIGAGKAYPNEEAWIKDHAFYFKKDGSLALRPNHAEPAFLVG